MATLNINSILTKYINKPSITANGIVLYTHVDGYSGELTAMEKLAIANSKIAMIGQSNFSSPTNVRRVFITGNRVVLQTYKPFIKGGKVDTAGCWNEYKFKEEDNIYDKVIERLNFNQIMDEYHLAKANGVTGIEKPKVTTLKGNGFKVFYKPWVMSNIEEIYVDWTFLCTDDIIQYHQDAAILVEDAFRNRGSGKLNSRLLQTLFEEANGINTKSIRNRYPRLKCIAMISNLDDVLNQHYDRGKTNTDAYTEYGKYWFEHEINNQLIRDSNSIVIINKLNDDIEALNRNFTVRDGVYKFDSEILKDFVADLQNRMLKYARDLRDARDGVNQSNDEVVTTKSEIEQQLDEMEAQSGLNVAKMTFLLSLSTMGKSQADAIINSLTPECKKKYLK